MVLTTLRLFNRYPFTNPLEIFKSDPTTGVLSLSYQFLGNPVWFTSRAKRLSFCSKGAWLIGFLSFEVAGEA
jgi:hypothetical protein